MANKITINITSPERRSDIGESEDTPPSPPPTGIPAAPAHTSGAADAPSAGRAPTPLPLEQVLPGFSAQDSAAPTPARLEDLPGAADSAAPSPLPLEELQAGD